MQKRETYIQEIKEFVEYQGTVVQEDNFEQVPVHHVTTDFQIKGKDILYIGPNWIYSSNNKKILFSELSDEDIYTIYNTFHI